MFLANLLRIFCPLVPLMLGTKTHFVSNVCDEEMNLAFCQWKCVEMLNIKNVIIGFILQTKKGILYHFGQN